MSCGRYAGPSVPRRPAKYCPSVQSAAMLRGTVCHVWRCVSTKPGTTIRSLASMTSASATRRPGPIAAMRPSSTSTSRRAVGSAPSYVTTRPSRMTMRSGTRGEAYALACPWEPPIAVPPPRTLTRKLLESRLRDGRLQPGEDIELDVDQVLLEDATGTMAGMQFEELGVDRVQVPLAVCYVDHNVLGLDHRNMDDARWLQAFCARYGVLYSRPGNGISHYVHLERYAKPGEVLVGADSHTTMAGAVGMLAIGAGGLDVAVAMAGHGFSLVAPTGGGVGRIFEFSGPGVATLTATERGTIANMIVETGGTTAVFPSDDQVRVWLDGQGRASDFVALAADEGAEYDETEELDLGALEPLIAQPSSPGDVVPVAELAGTEVAQGCVGSSVNSSYEDLAVDC